MDYRQKKSQNITKHFKKYMNTTFSGFIIKTRMEQAARFINTSNKSFTQIASECGYEDYSTFTQDLFHTMVHHPPNMKLVGTEFKIL